MTEIILAGLIGAIVGVGATIGISNMNKPPTPVSDETSKEQQEVIKQLTNLDIVKEICSPQYLTKQRETNPHVAPELLCRELSCLVFSRGIDSQTGGNGECESIGNISSSISIMEYCSQKSDEERSECIDNFWRRK